MKKMMFADVDGTFMDFNTYSMELSMEGVDLLRRNNIPLVLVSSKTYAEMTAIMDQAGLYNHFAFENGCGIAFPDGNGGYTTEISGPGTQVLKKKLILIEEITEKKFTSILDLADEEISAYSGLDMRRAALSKKRIATLPFISGDCELFSDSDIDELNIRLAVQGLRLHEVAGSIICSLHGQVNLTLCAESTRFTAPKVVLKQVRAETATMTLTCLTMLTSVIL